MTVEPHGRTTTELAALVRSWLPAGANRDDSIAVAALEALRSRAEQTADPALRKQTDHMRAALDDLVDACGWPRDSGLFEDAIAKARAVLAGLSQPGNNQGEREMVNEIEKAQIYADEDLIYLKLTGDFVTTFSRYLRDRDAKDVTLVIGSSVVDDLLSGIYEYGLSTKG